ncbi:hypothetical protein EVAR_90648_1 [Eumeta japonica]|uniref:Nucleic-acid-binding protein from transposon X-element n=1 Tax=Eumeta variegata TaxID=151549 RepID=A0A4C1T1G5_EUMVA|nr:hypothetical protein EVAR_90648_1 [Eumeta japonica]
MAESKRQLRGRENNRGDGLTSPLPHPAPRGRNHHLFVQGQGSVDRGAEGALIDIQFSQARNSVQGLKLQAKPSQFQNLQNLLGVCSLSGVKAEQPANAPYPGSVCQSYGHSSRYCYHSARCVKCLGDHGTAQCTRNKDTDGPPACVLCKQKGHGQLPWMPACSKDPSTRRPLRVARAVGGIQLMLERRLDRVTPRPPQRTLLHPLTI